MTWIEASGKTLEEAKQAAATELGVAVDRICAEILDEDKGFLGFGHLVRIRATVMDDEQNGIEEPSDSADMDEFEASIDVNVD
ncbi:MAG TPA: Jag N-terminal domain-containing protein, partial [Armatimonadota bacterium]|nr:Jag N-terminal domain-containing protein [Armatimonadota bacterium]